MPLPRGTRRSRWIAWSTRSQGPASRRTRGPIAVTRPGAVPPHNLEAEESLLGAMMLSPRGDHRRDRGPDRGERLLQARARPHLRRRVRAAQPGRAGRPGHRRRGAAARRPARRLGGTPTLVRDPGLDAGVGERVALRADRRRARVAAPAHRGRGRHHRDGLRGRRTTSTRRSTAPSRWSSRSPSTASPTRSMPLYPVLEADHGPARRSSTSASAHIVGVPTGYRDLDDLLLGLQPSTLIDRRGPARSGEDVARARRGARRRAGRPQAGAVLLAGDGPPRAHEAAPRVRGAHRRAQARDRQAHRSRVAEAQPGGRPARRGAVLHRRQPALHGHGDAGEGPPDQGAATATSA